MRQLPRTFYERHPKIVAQELLGKVLTRRLKSGELLSGRIVETEAYLGADDAAAHAAAGKTSRNEVLFGAPGRAYVYFTYGMHHCLNVSCEPEGHAGCVLFRALEPLAGMERMAKLRNVTPGDLKQLTSGPGRLCQALGITRSDNGTDLTSPRSGLFIADDGCEITKIATATRIGITKSAKLELRFYLAGNNYVSRK
jgi:DNA-3-methyladenine glycosylase